MPFNIKINELALPYDNRNLNTDSRKFIIQNIPLRLNMCLKTIELQFKKENWNLYNAK